MIKLKNIVYSFVVVIVFSKYVRIYSMAEEIDYEREYSPSMWSKRYPTAKQVIQHHIDSVTTASLAATKHIPHELDIEYGHTVGQKLDIFGTDLPKDAPIFVYIHGGYWQMLSRNISRYPAGPLHREGIKTIVIGFDLCPNVTLQQLVNEVENAVRFVFQYAENMGSRGVYFAGHSAGAHLVAKTISNATLLANLPGANRLQGAFLVSGVYHLSELIKTSENDAVRLTEESARSLSPYFDDFTHLKDRSLRIHVIAAENDSPRFKQQSEDFYKVLYEKYSLPNVHLDIKANFDHFDIVECFSNDDNYLKILLVNDIKAKL